MANPMYNAVLKWSLSQTDGTSPSEVKEMDPEKRKFLEAAMDGLLEDETKKMQDLVAAIQAPEGTSEQIQAKENALDELLDRCDRIDYAMSFHSFGKGLIPTIELLKSSNDGIRLRAADLVALCCQNNPKCQEWALEGGAMQLLHALHSDLDVDVDVRTKALSAMSSLIQHCPPGEAMFLQLNGMATLKANVEGISRRVRVKTLFMLQWLLHDSPVAAAAAVNDGLPTVLAGLVQDADEDIAENSAGSLVALLLHQRESAGLILGQFPNLVTELATRLKGLETVKDSETSDYLVEKWKELVKILESK